MCCIIILLHSLFIMPLREQVHFKNKNDDEFHDAFWPKKFLMRMNIKIWRFWSISSYIFLLNCVYHFHLVNIILFDCLLIACESLFKSFLIVTIKEINTHFSFKNYSLKVYFIMVINDSIISIRCLSLWQLLFKMI